MLVFVRSNLKIKLIVTQPDFNTKKQKPLRIMQNLINTYPMILFGYSMDGRKGKNT